MAWPLYCGCWLRNPGCISDNWVYFGFMEWRRRQPAEMCNRVIACFRRQLLSPLTYPATSSATGTSAQAVWSVVSLRRDLLLFCTLAIGRLVLSGLQMCYMVVFWYCIANCTIICIKMQCQAYRWSFSRVYYEYLSVDDCLVKRTLIIIYFKSYLRCCL